MARRLVLCLRQREDSEFVDGGANVEAAEENLQILPMVEDRVVARPDEERLGVT